MLAILVNVSGLLLIALIIWWFILYRPNIKRSVDGTIDIYVNNGVYEPAFIKIEKSQKTILRFHRFDTTPCAEIVSFNTLGIVKKLPINQPFDIAIQINEPGEYEFTCQMKMYRGVILVE